MLLKKAGQAVSRSPAVSQGGDKAKSFKGGAVHGVQSPLGTADGNGKIIAVLLKEVNCRKRRKGKKYVFADL